MYDSDFLAIPQWDWTEAGVTAACNQLNSVLSSYIDGGASTAKFKIRFWPVVDPRVSGGETYMIKGTTEDSSSGSMLIRLACLPSNPTAAGGVGISLWVPATNTMVWSSNRTNGDAASGSGLFIIFGDSAFGMYTGTAPNDTGDPLFVANDAGGKPIAYAARQNNSDAYLMMVNPTFGSSSFNIQCLSTGWNPTSTDFQSTILVPCPVSGPSASNLAYGIAHPVQFSKLFSGAQFGDVIMTSGDENNPAQKRYYTHRGFVFIELNEVS
jgi:hypothetical protein